jgi:hypothetical protein
MFVEFCHPSPKAGIKEHVAREVAAALLASGLAREVVLTPEQKLAMRFGNDPFAPAKPTPPPTWFVYRTAEFGDLVISRKQADGSTAIFNSPPSDCPADVAKKFSEMQLPGDQPVLPPFAGTGWREKLPL